MRATRFRMFRLLLGALAAGVMLVFSTATANGESSEFTLGASPLFNSEFAALPPGNRLPQNRIGQPTPEPGMMFDPTDRLAPPPMSDPPTQIEQGAYAYYLSCMVCHGDRGQGLTEEWRGALDPADRNCWQSRCHAPNHPPGGFQLPRYAPAIIGPGMLAHYESAGGLHEFLRTRMPWQAPGILSDEAYWQLTAFLLDANGFSIGSTDLGPGSATKILLNPAPGLSSPAPVGPLLFIAAVPLLLFGVWFLWRHGRAP